MRVTMRTMYNQIKTDMGRITDRLTDTQTKISSGLIYKRPSDAPVELNHALSLRSGISKKKQLHANIVYGQGWSRATESAIDKVQDRVLRAKTLAIQGANDSQNADTRRYLAEEVKGIIDEVLALSNTKFGGRYIFGGTKTRGYVRGEAPFVMKQDGTVEYKGNEQDIKLAVAEGLNSKINMDGKEVFMEGGVFDALKDLYDGLMSNSQPDIELAVSKFDNVIEHINNKLAKAGAISNSLASSLEIVDDLTVNDKERLSDVQDIDLAESIADLNSLQTSYQASLASASKVMQLSLADFI